MRLSLLLAILLISHPCSARKTKIIDWEFAVDFLRSYFCTGNQDWWKNISEDPVLRYTMRVGVIMFCHPTKFVDVESMRELVKHARFAVEKQTRGKRTTVTNCLWDGIKNWNIAPFFCPLPSKIFMKNYDLVLDSALDMFCVKDKILDFWCIVGALIARGRDAIREKVPPHLCASHRLKRQFDANSGMAIFEQLACLNSVDYNFNYVALEKGNHLHFVTFGYWCCIIQFVET